MTVIKGTVSVISSDPPGKNCNFRFTTLYPQKLCLIKFELDIQLYNFESSLFSILVSTTFALFYSNI